MKRDAERREQVDRLRLDLLKGVRFARDGGSFFDDAPMMNAKAMIWRVLDDLYGHDIRPTFAEISRDLGLNDEVLRQVIVGEREPAKAFLDAVGYERVVLYREKPKQALS